MCKGRGGSLRFCGDPCSAEIVVRGGDRRTDFLASPRAGSVWEAWSKVCQSRVARRLLLLLAQKEKALCFVESETNRVPCCGRRGLGQG